MSHVQHELHDEFPEYKEKIHALKIGDRHFARLFDEYHVVNVVMADDLLKKSDMTIPLAAFFL